MDIKILVATHIPYKMPSDDIYLPIHVGRELKSESIHSLTDNTGENISDKNLNFCELTAIYWAWKNLKADYIGLTHYRRYFSSKRTGDKWGRIMDRTTAEKLLSKTDVILPKKRRYFVETNYNHYIHAHNKEGLDKTIEIINRDFQDYSTAAANVMKRTSAHMFNMFIMKREFFESYCDFLFSVLFTLEKELDISQYTPFEARVFGRIGEMLLDIWVEKNNISYTENPLVFMERTNWLHKGAMFSLRGIGVVKKNERY